MEVKINREIRNYTESVFFGLSMRQFFSSIIGIALAVIVYFLFKEKVGLEITSWLCVLCVAPFAALGFIKYNGMNIEDAIVAYIKSEILTPKELKFEGSNIYYEVVSNYYDNLKKEELKRDKIFIKHNKTRKRKNKNTKED